MKNEELGSKIKEARQAKGWSQDELAAFSDVGQSTVDRLEKGQFKKISQGILNVIAVLGLRMDEDVAGAAFTKVWEQGSLIPKANLVGQKRDFPVYASVEGGAGQIIRDTDPIEFFPRPAPVEHTKDAYGLIVTGDSMVPEFEPGDIAIISPRAPLFADRTCVFYSEKDGEARATIKRLRRYTGDTWFLKQWNPPEGMKTDFTLKKEDWPVCHPTVGKFTRR